MTEAKAFLGGDAFAEFIQGRKILIADPNSTYPLKPLHHTSGPWNKRIANQPGYDL